MAQQPKSRATTVRKKDSTPQKLLTPEEIEQIRVWGLQQCHQMNRAGAIVVTLLGTAARRFEACALRVKDIRQGPGGPEVFFPQVKGGGTATVPISNDTFTVLNRWKEQHDLIGLPNDPLLPVHVWGQHTGTQGDLFMHPATLWRAWREALKQAGIARQVGVHASRHAAGFLILRATGDLTKVQTFLRHSSIATTDKWYKHVHLPDLRAGLERAGI